MSEGATMRAYPVNGIQATVLPIFLALAATAASAQVIQNGSFESPAIAENSVAAIAPDSWAWGAHVGLVFNGKVGSIWPEAFDGEQFVDIGNEPIYYLTQSFSLPGAGLYWLKWHDNTGANIPGYHTSPYSVAILDPAEQVLLSADFDAYHDVIWLERTLALKLDAGIYTLRFRAEGVFNGTDTLLDSVAIAAVPEGSTASLYGAGLLAVTAALRRIRQKRGC